MGFSSVKFTVSMIAASILFCCRTSKQRPNLVTVQMIIIVVSYCLELSLEIIAFINIAYMDKQLVQPDGPKAKTMYFFMQL